MVQVLKKSVDFVSVHKRIIMILDNNEPFGSDG